MGKVVGMQKRVCLVIDEEVFAWLREASIPNSQVDSSSPSIKVIDGALDHDHLDEFDSSYRGWALFDLRLL